MARPKLVHSWVQSRSFASACYQQFLRLERMEESTGALADLVETERQHRYAAELWKSLAERREPLSLTLTDFAALLLGASDKDVMEMYNIIESVAQRRGLMG